MRMMLVGAGAVGESMLKIMQRRDSEKNWLEFVLIGDYDLNRAQQVAAELDDPQRFQAIQLDATDTQSLAVLARQYNIDFVMDAAPPFASNKIFDAAFLADANYASMGTWSVPMDEPKLGLGIENSYVEPMTKYNFDRHEQWRQKGRMAVICIGIDPGVVNVFAKYAAVHLFDTLEEVHIKDGGDLAIPGADEDDVSFGFNVWTVMDEVLNPNVEYDADRGGLIVEAPLQSGQTFFMPEGIGDEVFYKVEHEETVTLPRYLRQYGLKKASFRIYLDPALINALKVIDRLGLRSLKPVNVHGVSVVPRDVVAACAPQPVDIGTEMTGRMCVGAHCIGLKDGKRREVFLYQTFGNEESEQNWGTQAVVTQTGFGAALSVELIAKGIWKDAGVFSPEYFDPDPYMELMRESGFRYAIEDRTPKTY